MMNRKPIALHSKSWRTTGAIVGIAVCLLAVGILLASRQPAPDAEAISALAPEAAAVAAPEPAPAKPRARKAQQPRKAAAPKPVPVKVNTAASDVAAPRAVAAEAPAAKAAPAGELTTITGCLEVDDETFRLKDVEGESAPKKRSWKSGFIKKGSAKVELIDASNRLKLQNHVGHRIRVSGSLIDRELHARSLQMVASSCGN